MAASPSFTVNTSEAVNVTGTPRIAVDVGGVTRYATYASGSGTSSLTFTYSPQTGDLDLDGVSISSPIDLNGGTITDLNGNPETNLTFTIPDTSGVKIDYPSLSMDFISDDYILSGTHYSSLTSFLFAAGGSFTRGGSVATYFDSSGTMQTAGSSVARFDYDPTTHTANGVLFEGARTNYLKRSSEFDNSSAWAPNNVTVTPDNALAPDGTMSADLITTNSIAANTGFVSQSQTESFNTFSASVYAKAGNVSRFRMQPNSKIDGTYTGIGIIFDLSAISATNTGNYGGHYTYVSSSIVSVGGGWYRCTIVYTISGIAFEQPASYWILPYTSGDSIGSNMYFWGAQIELGTFPTSYIPTTTAAATRGEDFLTIPTGAWYDFNVGSFYNDISWAASAGTGYPMFFRVDDGTGANRWNLYYNQNSNTVGTDAFNGNVTQGSFSIAASTSGYIRAAGAQALDNANVAYNGVLKTLDTNWSPPTAVTQLRLYGAGARKWHKKLRYYPARVSDTQLQLLTQ